MGVVAQQAVSRGTSTRAVRAPGRIPRSITSSIATTIAANPIVRAIVALVFFAVSLGGLTLVAYADQYVNGGVAWAPWDRAAIPNTDLSPLGVNVSLEKEVDPAKLEHTVEMVQDGGFKWVRQTFAWNDIEISGKGDFVDRRNPPAVVSSWDKYDRIVDACVRHGLQIIARLDSPPVWARIPGDDVEKFRKGPPNNYQDYADFVSAVVSRYKGKVKYFQIWNEPNLYGEWGGHPVDPEQYTQLLKLAYQAAKAANPDAVIITAALAPTAEDTLANENDVLYLEGMYRAGAAPYFDILSTMLYGLGQPPDERRTDLKRLNFSRPILLRRVMEKYGDTRKPIWISEYAWISLPGNWQAQYCSDPNKPCGTNIWGQSVDEQTQAQWEVEGYERARSEWPWMGVMCVWYFREPDPHPEQPANWFAIVNPDFTPRPAYTALKENSALIDQVGPKPEPLLDAAGFPLLYAFAGLLALASATVGGASLGRWAQAALNRPRGAYSDAARELARNGAAVVGMALLTALYYSAGSLPLALACLAALGLLFCFKPSTGLAGVVFTIPFFWYPKVLGQEHFPLAETLLVLVFLAVVARYAVGYVVRRGARGRGSGVGGQLSHLLERVIPGEPRQQNGSSEGSVHPRSLASLGVAPSDGASTPSPITQPLTPDDELAPASWPQRPGPVPAAQAVLHKQATQVTGGIPDGLGKRPLPAVRSLASPASEVRQSTIPNPKSQTVARFLAWNREDAFAPPAVVLLVLGALSLLWLADPSFARDSARDYRWVIIEPVLLYFLITDAIKSKRGLWRLADFFVAAAVFVSFVGLVQFAGNTDVLDVEGVSRVMGVYQHPNNLGLYLGRVLPFTACLAIFLPWSWRKVAYGLACLPLAATLFLTFSRGAWLGVAAALVVAVGAGLWWRPGRKHVHLGRRSWLGMVAGAVVLVVLVAGVVVLLPKLPTRIFGGGSGMLRIDIWEASLKMLRDHPVLGVGLDQFLNQFQAHYLTPALEQEKYTAHPHNLVLDYWLSLGIMGVLVLLWLLWRYFGEALAVAKRAAHGTGLAGAAGDPAARALALGLLASMVDFLVHGLVDNSYFLMDLAMIFWLSCGMLQCVRSGQWSAIGDQ